MRIIKTIKHAWAGVTFLPRWVLAKLGWGWSTAYRAMRVDEFPESLRPQTVYLAGDPGHLWGAALACPCGCGDTIELNLLPQVRPCWAAEVHPDRSITLMPSVWRRNGCKSHFFVRRGKVDWC